MEMYAYQEDCAVERNLEEYPGMAVLMDCDGHALMVVPDTWEDHQLFTALALANDAFRYGKKVGRNEMVADVHKLLEINI